MISVVYVKTELELLRPIELSVISYWSNWVRSMIKTRQDNDSIDPIKMAYTKNKIALLWSIESGADCDENQIRKQHDWSYKYGLHQK